MEGPRHSLLIRKSLHQLARCHRLGAGTPVNFPKALDEGRLAFPKPRATDEEILEMIEREWIDGPESDSEIGSESDSESDSDTPGFRESSGAGERGARTEEAAADYKTKMTMLNEGR